MHTLFQNSKVVLVANPQLKDNGAATVTYADAKGWDHATLLIATGAMDIALNGKLQESDASGSGYADITGAAITEVADTGDGTMMAIEVDLTAGVRKRFLQPVLTAGDGSTGVYVAAVIILTRGEASPATAAGAGLAELVKV